MINTYTIIIKFIDTLFSWLWFISLIRWIYMNPSRRGVDLSSIRWESQKRDRRLNREDDITAIWATTQTQVAKDWISLSCIDHFV